MPKPPEEKDLVGGGDEPKKIEDSFIASLGPEAPELGILVIESQEFIFDFAINHNVAEMLIDQLQEFLSGKSKTWAQIEAESRKQP